MGGERSVSQDMMFAMMQAPTPTPDQNSHLLRGPKDRPRTNNGEATQKILQVAQQANELLMAQAKIDMEVQERWGACNPEGAVWAGQLLPSTVFDMAGRCRTT